MAFFPVLMFQQWFLAVFLGVALVIAIYVAWGTYTHRREARTKEELDQYHGHEVGPEPGTAERPLFPIVVYLLIGVIVWGIFYFVFYGIRGEAIG